MKTEVIYIGEGLLDGALSASAPAFVSSELYKNGYDVTRVGFIQNNKKDIVTSLASAIKRSRMILLIGSLGGNKNDIAKEAVAEALGFVLEPDAAVYSDIYERFADVQSDEMIRKQSSFPKGAVLFRNRLGSAYGFAVNSATQHIVFLPFESDELCDILQNSAKDFLTLYCDDKNTITTVCISNTTKSAVEAELLEEIDMGLVRVETQKSYTVAFIMLKKGSRTMGEKIIRKIVKRFGADVCGIDCAGSEDSVVSILKKKKLTVSFAESCTGGLISKRITDISGASGVMQYSTVCYSEEAKNKELGVRLDTIRENTVVSAQVAEEMALGVKVKSGANIGLSVTGIAGPDTDIYQNPVGLVYISLCDGKYSYTKEERFSEDLSREQIRDRAASSALDLLRIYLLAYPQKMTDGSVVEQSDIERLERYFAGLPEQEPEETDAQLEEEEFEYPETTEADESAFLEDVVLIDPVPVTPPLQEENDGEDASEDPFNLKFID